MKRNDSFESIATTTLADVTGGTLKSTFRRKKLPSPTVPTVPGEDAFDAFPAPDR